MGGKPHTPSARRRPARFSFTLLAAAALLALALAVGATFLGAKVSSPSIVDFSSGTCVTEYRSFGWPLQWKTEMTQSELARLVTPRGQGALGITDNGVSPSAFGMSAGLWFLVAFSALLLLDVVARKQWRDADASQRFFIGVVLALGFAAGATILGTLATTSGAWGGIPYESSGLPLQWKTSPWVQPWAQDRGIRLLLSFRLLGFSPLWLTMTFTFWLFVAASAEALAFFAWSRHSLARTAGSFFATNRLV